MALEVELKLAIAPADAPRLHRHPLLKAVKPTRRKLYGIYFDTPDFALQKQRSAFRLRREGFHWVQTVKLDRGTTGGLSMRPEYESLVTGNQPDFNALPEEARTVLTTEIRHRLAPLFVTDFQRTAWHIERPDGVVEVALDIGHILAGEAKLPVAEVELELLSGEVTALFEVAQALLDAVPLVPEYRSKALRGYQLAGVWREKPCKAVTAEIKRHMPAAEAWRRLLLAGLNQLSHNIPGLLADPDPEYLHQTRVAVRRMHTVLGLGRRIDLVSESWIEDLRWFMAELSPARDWDVMVNETLAAVRTGLPNPERIDTLFAAATIRRETAGARARAAVRNPRFTRLILAMTRELMTPLASGPRLSDWSGVSLDRRLRRLRRLGKSFDTLDATGRHQLRIAAKRLRYAGEAFAQLYGDKTPAYLEITARLQDGLGIVNDVAVAHRLLAELIAQDKQLVHSAALSEGFIVGTSIGHVERMGDLVTEILTTRPFWRRRQKHS
jgi:inorganic triphosphatase YgiF